MGMEERSLKLESGLPHALTGSAVLGGGVAGGHQGIFWKSVWDT